MPFIRPALADLIARAQQDFISGLDDGVSVLRRSMLDVFAKVTAGAAHLQHGHLEYVSQQQFADQSDADNLTRQAGLFGVTVNPATTATRVAAVGGIQGSLVPALTVLTSQDGSVTYTVDTDVTKTSPVHHVDAVPITCTTPGSIGNLPVGTTLNFQSPPPGIEATADLVAGGEDGTDTEDIEDMRARFIERMQSTPQGGASEDYVEWAKQVTGVTRAWAYPLELGAGTMTVRFMRDDDASPIPDSGAVAAVAAYIAAVRPATANVTVLAPVADAQNFTIHIVPDSTTTRAAVTAELQDFLTRAAEPGGTETLSQFFVAIGLAEGITDFTMSSPAANVTHSTGHIATLGTITWT
jgi:uncharacterized phage protein gp47/JayE